MHHGHGRARGGGDHIDLPVHPGHFFHHDHGKIAGTRADVARARGHAVRGRHAGARVALRRGEGNAGPQIPRRVQPGRARRRQAARLRARGQHPGQDLPQPPAIARLGDEGVEFRRHIGVVIQFFAVDGEHAAGLADTQGVFAGEDLVNVARQGGQVGEPGQVVLLFQHGLVQMGDAPALGDVEIKQRRQLLRRFAGHGVAPGAEFRQRLPILVEGQIAVHHGADAHGPHGGEGRAEFFLHVALEVRKAMPHAVLYVFHGVGPHAVQQAVFPFVAAGGDGDVLFIQQHRLDAGGAQLQAQNRFFQIHPIHLFDCRCFIIAYMSDNSQ